MARVAINIVTYNSGSVIDQCLEAAVAQTYGDVELQVTDNASNDDTVTRLYEWRKRGVRVFVNETNQYYSRAHNDSIQRTDSEFVVTLNPDVLIMPDYLSHVLRAFELSSAIGSVNGKLLSVEPGGLHPGLLDQLPSEDALIDGAGLAMFPSRRPYLRGNRQANGASCLRPGYIFGVDGACGTYRRSMLEDIAPHGEYFDNDFVIYREDVDLAWRALLFGWDSYYQPQALGYHVRGFRLGQNRRRIPADLRRHSVKNGWLLLIKNDSPVSALRAAPWIVPYQLKILGGIIVTERSSLGAIMDAVQLLPDMLRKRGHIEEGRKRSPAEIGMWLRPGARNLREMALP